MTLADRQHAFGAALLDNRLAPPPGLVGPDGQPSARRFAVYRRNVVSGLIAALQAGFPVLHRLVGDEFFRAMAGVYARAEPPASPVLSDYGAGFADFIAAFPPLAHLPWLADVARLERAWTEVYHAAEAQPADVTPLLALPPATLGGIRVTLHPALRLIRSPHPVLTIWQRNQPGAEPSPVPMDQAEDVLLLRPAAEVKAILLDPGVASFLARLAEGRPLSEAAAAGFLDTPRFDFASALTSLLLSGALTGWRLPDPS